MQMLDLAFGALFLNFPPPPRTPSVNFKSSYFHMEGAARKTKAYFEKTWADSGHFSQKIFFLGKIPVSQNGNNADYISNPFWTALITTADLGVGAFFKKNKKKKIKNFNMKNCYKFWDYCYECFLII